MALHLIRAWSVYKDIRIHSFDHTCYKQAFLVMGWCNEKAENNRSVCGKDEKHFQF